MRRLIEATYVSLDGVIESPATWSMPYWDEEQRSYVNSRLADYDAFLLGRVTYQEFAATWPQIKGDPYFDTINGLPKFVASRTLRETTWNATVLNGDTADAVRQLKRQPGKNIVKYGTGNLDRILTEHGLIDEFHFSVFPVVVGRGKRLFEDVDTKALNLKLIGTKTFGNGVVLLKFMNEGGSR